VTPGRGAFRPSYPHFSPPPLQFGAWGWNPRGHPPRIRPSQAQKAATTMAFIQTLGPSLPVVLMFFGVLLFSVSMAVIAVLADY